MMFQWVKFTVIGDVSFEQNLDVFKDLHVHQKTNIDNDVSMGAHLNVGDVSFEQNLDVLKNLHIKKTNLIQDVQWVQIYTYLAMYLWKIM